MPAAANHSYIEHLGPPVVRAGVVQPISPAVSVTPGGRLVFVSGQVPMVNGVAAAAGISGQTHAVIDMIEAILLRAGCALPDVVKVTVWLTDAGDYRVFQRG
jgi:2-iminobutanoate/2-iminopropanoate deaminase